MFHMDVTNVDWDVPYVVMVVHVCCNRLSSMFHLFFQTYVASVFIWMLHMFHIYVASVFIWMLLMFAMIFNCFCKYFRCMFRMFYLSFLYVTSIVSGCFKSRSGVAH